MPAVLRAVAEIQPITPVIEAVRALLPGMPVGDSWWIALAWFVPITAAAYVSAPVLFRHCTAR